MFKNSILFKRFELKEYNMSNKCIYFDNCGIRCNKRAWFPLIHSRYCFQHRKLKDPYILLPKNQKKKPNKSIFDLYNFNNLN